MEQNLPIVPKKFYKIIRVIYFMLRKGISKVKLLANLNIMMNRAKITVKLASIHDLMFHHHAATASDNHPSYPVPLNEYEFSCSNSTAFTNFLPFNLNKRKNHHTPSPIDGVLMAMMNSVSGTPALPGFGSTPNVRQLRITDSPFPLRDADVDNHVDEAAEEFILKFHRDLRNQNAMAYLGYS